MAAVSAKREWYWCRAATTEVMEMTTTTSVNDGCGCSRCKWMQHEQCVTRTRNSKWLDAKKPATRHGCSRKFNNAKTMWQWRKGSDCLGHGWTNLTFFVAFSGTPGMKSRCNLDYEKLENLTEQPENWYHLIEARVPIFRWDDNYQFGGVDFDDPTTNVHDVAP